MLVWFEKHGREYPWRSSVNPFHVLTAEVMLQRTRADQVEPVYVEMTETVSSPAGVLGAGEDVIQEWFGRLGLRWRAEKYLSLCRELEAKYGGEVPDEREALLELPGVGQYAAGSVLTNAFGKPTGVLDSNILRVYARYFGLEFDDGDRRRQQVFEWSERLTPDDAVRGRAYNLALVDFGAAVCTPSSPLCGECPLAGRCSYAGSARDDAPSS